MTTKTKLHNTLRNLVGLLLGLQTLSKTLSHEPNNHFISSCKYGSCKTQKIANNQREWWCTLLRLPVKRRCRPDSQTMTGNGYQVWCHSVRSLSTLLILLQSLPHLDQPRCHILDTYQKYTSKMPVVTTVVANTCFIHGKKLIYWTANLYKLYTSSVKLF